MYFYDTIFISISSNRYLNIYLKYIKIKLYYSERWKENNGIS